MSERNERSDRNGPRGGACRPTAELLPWYVNGTLEPGEGECVEAHLAVCPACRDELALCREMAAAIPAGESLAPAAHPARLARLMERLGDPVADRHRAAGGAGLGGRLRWWRGSVAEAAQPVRWLMAGQLAAITVLGVALVLVVLALGDGEGSGAPAGRTFRTLSDAPAAAPSGSGPAAASAHARIRVVFDPALTEEGIRSLLLELRAQVVGGPSPLGAYTLEVPTGSSEDDPLEVVLGYLRAQPAVRFAEPVAAP